jgi:methylenetetrahydrofolate dehydrogenase (NADP+)/methenyltetrahydrofolate cyclohydrolase
VERAELVVAAVGKPSYIPGIWIRDGALVVELAQALAHQAMFAIQLNEFAEQSQRAAVLDYARSGRGPHDHRHAPVNTVDAALARKGVKAG